MTQTPFVAEPKEDSVTSTVLPSGVAATSPGSGPSGIEVRIWPVERSRMVRPVLPAVPRRT